MSAELVVKQLQLLSFMGMWYWGCLIFFVLGMYLRKDPQEEKEEVGKAKNFEILGSR